MVVANVSIQLPVRGYFRGSSPLIVVAPSRRVALLESEEVLRRFEELMGRDFLDKLADVFSEILKNEISTALTSENLVSELPVLVERFWYRLLSPLAELQFKLFSSMVVNRELLDAFAEAEKALARALARGIRSTGYERSEDLVYALSVLVDRDLWILKKSAETGLENLLGKLTERDLGVVVWFASYSMYLAFTWISATSAVLGLLGGYRRENLDTLASWSRAYAEEVEDYLDTMDTLLDDEAYEELLRLGVVRR